MRVECKQKYEKTKTEREKMKHEKQKTTRENENKHMTKNEK